MPVAPNAPPRPLPAALLGFALVGAAAALGGAYLDDAWHTSRGRDSFFIAPHIAIYGGVGVIGAVLAIWVLRMLRRGGRAAVRRRPSAILAVVALAGTLASAPVDNAWHVAFGRDAVLWSPPHLLGIVGTLALGSAILMEARARPWARLAAGGLVLAAANFTVAEYETDVPQFSAAFYLPALAAAAIVGLSIVRPCTPGDAWAGTKASIVHGLFVAAIALLLRATGFPAPSVPVVIAAAVALDLSSRRRLVVRAGLVVAALALAIPVRRLLGSDVRVDAKDLATGAALAFGVALVLLSGVQRALRPRSVAPLAAGATVVALLLLPAVALAHDPGQGEDAGAARLQARGAGKTVRLSGRLRPCRPIRSGRVLARRAGDTIDRPLRVRGCSFDGTVGVTELGRWFVYADLESESGPVETWISLVVRSGHSRSFAANRFAYTPSPQRTTIVKGLGGGALYLAVAALLFATLWAVSRPVTRPAAAAHR